MNIGCIHTFPASYLGEMKTWPPPAHPQLLIAAFRSASGAALINASLPVSARISQSWSKSLNFLTNPHYRFVLVRLCEDGQALVTKLCQRKPFAWMQMFQQTSMVTAQLVVSPGLVTPSHSEEPGSHSWAEALGEYNNRYFCPAGAHFLFYWYLWGRQAHSFTPTQKSGVS